MDSMIKLDTSGIFAELELFSGRVKAPMIRTGSAAAARVLYEEARRRCPVKTGLLKSSIYRVLSESESKPGRVVYHVSWNVRKAPHGHFIEFGTSKAAARPFLRPAYESAKAEAIAAGIEAMRQKIQDGG